MVRAVLKRVLFAVLVLAVLGFAALFGVGWYYSDQIEEGAFRVVHDDTRYNLEVVDVDEGLITLHDPAGNTLDRRGYFGLIWSGGYGHIEFPEAQDDGSVVWQFTPLTGTPEVGERVHIDRSAYPDNPEAAHGIPFEDVAFPAPLGNLGAWYIEGTEDTWVIFVHGRGGNRREALRSLPHVHDLGFPCLVIDYRNDVGAPRDPSGYFQFGVTEWEDVEAAVRYALDNGAESVALVGYSMGGAVVTKFLLESDLVEHVDAAILHAPPLDLSEIVNDSGDERGLPRIVPAVARWITSLRFGIDWGELNMLSRANELSTPILLFHTTADPTVPVRTSDALAERRPDIVQYVRLESNEHVGAWNVDRTRYEATVKTFLRENATGLAATP